MAAAITSFILPDGRALDGLLGGHAAGLALVMHHGPPSDSTTFTDWGDACHAPGSDPAFFGRRPVKLLPGTCADANVVPMATHSVG